jgi:hypothetical protein
MEVFACGRAIGPSGEIAVDSVQWATGKTSRQIRLRAERLRRDKETGGRRSDAGDRCGEAAVTCDL